ncbi:MAG: futalosine hydrolase [Bacteroidota bacterium]
MKLLIVSATPFEVAPVNEHLTQHFKTNKEGFLQRGQLEVQLLCTGVGMTATAYALSRQLQHQQYDLIVNAGIAGAFSGRGLQIGDVVSVASEQFADLGVEDSQAKFTDVHEMALVDGNSFPFSGSKLLNPSADQYKFLPSVAALTVNKVHGSAGSIQKIMEKYPADIESMEGAAFFYCCLMEKQNFLQIRSISNEVEVRNKDNWNIPLAIDNLNKVLLQMMEITQ